MTEAERPEFSVGNEAAGAISLKQASDLAISHATENPDFYGPKYLGQGLIWAVVSSAEHNGLYSIRVSYRPLRGFRGEPGVELFNIDKTGSIESRQILSEPRPRPRVPLAVVCGGIVVLIGAVAGIFFGVDLVLPPVSPSPINVSAMLSPGAATELVSPEGEVRVSVPEGSVAADANLAYNSLSPDDIPLLLGSFTAVAKAFDLSVVKNGSRPVYGFKFVEPVTVTVTFTESDVVMASGDQSRIVIYHYKAETGWRSLPTTVDFQELTAKAQVDTLSPFALIIKGPGPTAFPTKTPVPPVEPTISAEIPTPFGVRSTPPVGSATKTFATPRGPKSTPTVIPTPTKVSITTPLPSLSDTPPTTSPPTPKQASTTTTVPAPTPTLPPTLPPKPTPTLAPTLPPPTLAPTSPPKPTPTPIPRYRLIINGIPVAPNRMIVPVTDGTITVNEIPGRGGEFQRDSEVILGVYPDISTAKVTWFGVDEDFENMATVTMNRDRHVVVDIRTSGEGISSSVYFAPTPTPRPIAPTPIPGSMPVPTAPTWAPGEMSVPTTTPSVVPNMPDYIVIPWVASSQASEVPTPKMATPSPTLPAPHDKAPIPRYTLTTFANPPSAGVVGPGTPTIPQSYDRGAELTLTVSPNSGYTFTGWEGACTGTGPCVIKMHASETVTANFTPVFSLTVECSGPGSVGPQACGTIDTHNFGRLVTLIATPEPGTRFHSWSGEWCTGTGSCLLIMNSNQTVGATFEAIPAPPSKPTYTLTTNVNPPSAGTVSPSGATTYPSQSLATVTKTVASGFAFVGWSGGCHDTKSCVVLMEDDQTVTANFVRTFTLTTLSSPSTGGTVSPGGTTTHNSGSQLTLTAAEAAGYEFTGWESEDCLGDSACFVNMDANKTVTANFVQTFTLTASASPVEGGTVSPDGSKVYPTGTKIPVTASPATGYVFTHWSGDCDGSEPCVVTLGADQTVTANFQLMPIIVPPPFPRPSPTPEGECADWPPEISLMLETLPTPNDLCLMWREGVEARYIASHRLVAIDYSYMVRDPRTREDRPNPLNVIAHEVCHAVQHQQALNAGFEDHGYITKDWTKTRAGAALVNMMGWTFNKDEFYELEAAGADYGSAWKEAWERHLTEARYDSIGRATGWGWLRSSPLEEGAQLCAISYDPDNYYRHLQDSESSHTDTKGLENYDPLGFSWAEQWVDYREELPSWIPAAPITLPGESFPLIDDAFSDGNIDLNIWVKNGLEGGYIKHPVQGKVWVGFVEEETETNLFFVTGSRQDAQLRTRENIGRFNDFTIEFRMMAVEVGPSRCVGWWLGNLAEGLRGDSHFGYEFCLHGGSKEEPRGFHIAVKAEADETVLHNRADGPEWSAGKVFDVRIERIGGELSIYVDDKLIASDNTYAGQMTELYWVTGRSWNEGRFGELGAIRMDDFRVTVIPTPLDTTPPARVTNLKVAYNPYFPRIGIRWTGPGDDGDQGVAGPVDIRFSRESITEETWDSAIPGALLEWSHPAGAEERHVWGRDRNMRIYSCIDDALPGVSNAICYGTKYYVGLKTADEAGNWSALSNIDSTTTVCAPVRTTPVEMNFSTGQNPKAIGASLGPTPLNIGDKVDLTLTLEETEEQRITSVVARLLTDNGRGDPVSLKLSSGTDVAGTWEGSLTLEDTICKGAVVAFKARSASGDVIYLASLTRYL